MKGTIRVENTANADANNINKKIFKSCTPFTDCIIEINKKQVNNAKDLDVVMLMYNLIEYSDDYAKPSRSLWHY